MAIIFNYLYVFKNKDSIHRNLLSLKRVYKEICYKISNYVVGDCTKKEGVRIKYLIKMVYSFSFIFRCNQFD